ncbi:MAG TPA: 6-hydroxymethylpterin diphosphokinase MptE-like protein [Planctomycetota bacterium]|nr:6-hydroxymethylpterin diphosphokinase MptE-like protein [Planctomycetota bacterium]
MSLYAEQRGALIASYAGFAEVMPAEPPASAPVAPTSAAERRGLLRVSANNHAAFLMILGWGDGTLVEEVSTDPLLRQKNVLVVAFEGEQDAFAASFRRPILPALRGTGISIVWIRRDEDVGAITRQRFGAHPDIPQLAGCDVVDGHPLTVPAQASRARWRDALMTALSDRPQAFGNDIGDSFTGLAHCAANARTLMPAPGNEQLRGLYGRAPAISIAAGPSLKRHIPRLRELQDRCVLVACDAVLHGLLAEGIVPHFVTPLERLKETAKMVAEVGPTRTVFAGLPVVHEDTLAPFAGRAVCICVGDQVYDWMFPERRHAIMAGSSSGVLSVSVAGLLTDGPVYMIGHDLSRDGEASHWTGSGFAAGFWKKIKDGASKGAVWQGGYEDRVVPRNGGGQVPSITWWDRFRNEIGAVSLVLSRSGRGVHNVNAHDGIGAVIENSTAAPLPEPASLPLLPDTPLPPRDASRLDQWRGRASRLHEDGDALRAHMRALRADIAAAKRLPPDQWPIDELTARAGITECVSEGNRCAFTYFLRSALNNCLSDLHRRRRTSSTARSRWHALNGIDGFAHALENALTTLAPQLKEIADGAAN